jgi:chaperonin cofactor prefoldin
MDNFGLEKRRMEREQHRMNLRFRLAQIEDQIAALQRQKERLTTEIDQTDGAIAAFAEMQQQAQAAVNGVEPGNVGAG